MADLSKYNVGADTQSACVAVIILNTNRRDDTLACLRSLRESTYPHLMIIVLDNASSDGSKAAIESEFPEVQLIPLVENSGYAGNNNVGVALALAQNADWILILNEDTIVANDCIEQLVAVGESSSNIGIVGPMVYHADEPHVIQSAGGWQDSYWRFGHFGQNQQDNGHFKTIREVDWISGCALMIRRSAVTQIGVLNQRFFYYFEETEWCLRARRAHWRILHVPAARLWHKGVQRKYMPKPSVTYYSTRNRFLLLRTHKAPLYVWSIVWFEIVRTLVSWSLRSKWQNKSDHRSAVIRGVLDFVQNRTGMMPR